MPDRNANLSVVRALDRDPSDGDIITADLMRDELPRSPLALLSDGVTAMATIDLTAITHNWRKLQSLTPSAIASAVVKADAYGLGAVAIADSLTKAGCSLFFVARLSEAILLRQELSLRGLRPDIVVLDGMLPQTLPHFIAHNLIPALTHPSQVQSWLAHAPHTRQNEAMIHVDSGMNRLGMSMKDASQLFAIESVKATNWRAIISHLACADSARHPHNAVQRENFSAILKLMPHIPASLAASEGIALGPDYHFDLTRPGISLYGLTANRHGMFGRGGSVTLRSALLVSAQILQSRLLEAGEAVGYGASFITNHQSRIITIGLGYEDGFPRLAGGKAQLHIGGKRVKLAGRVSMDLMSLDVSGIAAEFCGAGEWVDLIVDTDDIHDLAEASLSSPYEILTRIGKRVHRVYR